jgi:hypothetical protein
MVARGRRRGWVEREEGLVVPDAQRAHGYVGLAGAHAFACSQSACSGPAVLRAELRVASRIHWLQVQDIERLGFAQARSFSARPAHAEPICTGRSVTGPRCWQLRPGSPRHTGMPRMIGGMKPCARFWICTPRTARSLSSENSTSRSGPCCRSRQKWPRLSEQHSPIYKWTAGGC